MVSVSGKPVTLRSATAVGHICISSAAARLVRQNAASKGDVIATARVAGIMAAKKTPDLIPLCHPIALTKVSVDLRVVDSPRARTTSLRSDAAAKHGAEEPIDHGDAAAARIEVSATAECEGVTGVEMEALTACSVSLLTCYDMLKAVDKRMQIGGVRVVGKKGGKSGDWRLEGTSAWST